MSREYPMSDYPQSSFVPVATGSLVFVGTYVGPIVSQIVYGATQGVAAVTSNPSMLSLATGVVTLLGVAIPWVIPFLKSCVESIGLWLAERQQADFLRQENETLRATLQSKTAEWALKDEEYRLLLNTVAPGWEKAGEE